MTIRPGVRLAERFLVSERIAKGGMGTVYRARDERLDRDVVIKVPAAHLIEDDAGRARFRREIEALRTIEHPHVVPILDAGEHEGTPWYALRYMRGGSLRDRMPHPATREELRWLAQIGAALDHCHEHGFIHRDVKPGNILFDEHGAAYLTDFGVAHLEDPEEQKRLTQTGVMPGSPAYMAPEQALQGVSTAQSDQYALGVATYEALAGRLPFDGDTPVRIAIQKRKGAHHGLRKAAPSVPTGAANSVQRAIHAVSTRRFPTCTEFANAVARGLRPAGRPWLHAKTGVIGFLAGGAALTLALVLLARSEEAPSAPSSGAEHRGAALPTPGSASAPPAGPVPSRKRTAGTADEAAAPARLERGRTQEAPVVAVEPTRIVLDEPRDGAWSKTGTIEVQGRAEGGASGTLLLDGTPIEVTGGAFAATTRPYTEGRHEILLQWLPVDETDAASIVTIRRTIHVDLSPPKLTLSRVLLERGVPSTVLVSGVVSDPALDPASGLVIAGRSVALQASTGPGDEPGAFLHRVRLDPRSTAHVSIGIVARDRAGWETRLSRSIDVPPEATLVHKIGQYTNARSHRILVRYAHVPVADELELVWQRSTTAFVKEASGRSVLATGGDEAGEIETTLDLSDDGPHAVWLERSALPPSQEMTGTRHSFVVDTHAPKLALASFRPPIGRPYWRFDFKVGPRENWLEVELGGRKEQVTKLPSGLFTLMRPWLSSTAPLHLEARDRAGNTTRLNLKLGEAEQALGPVPEQPDVTASQHRNQVLDLDGGGWVELTLHPRAALRAPCTIECWAYAHDRKSEQALIDQSRVAGLGLFWSNKERDGELRPRAIVFDQQLGGGMFASAAANRLPRKRWHHLALVFTGSAVLLYVDGTERGRERVSNFVPVDGAVCIGAQAVGSGSITRDRFRGMIDDVRISDVARYEGTFEPPRRLQSDDHTLVLLDFETQMGSHPVVRGRHTFLGRRHGSARIRGHRRPGVR